MSRRKSFRERFPLESLADQFRRMRRNHGMTQKQLGEKMGMSLTQLSYLETGRRPIRLHHIGKIADALGYDVEVLFSARAVK